MPANFVVEDGSAVDGANSYCSVADADQINLDYENSVDWIAATDAEKEMALRQATRYLDLHYIWDGYKVYEDQVLMWPRYEMYDEDDNYLAEDEIPTKVIQACVYLAIKVIEGDTLLEDFQNEGKVKKSKDVVGPLTEEREYVFGEYPDKTYQVADKLLASLIIGKGWTSTELERG